MLAENLADIIQAFASCTIALCAALGTRAAYIGLSSWKTEHAGKAAHDAARELLINLQKISEFSTILSSVWVPLNHLVNPQEFLHGATPQQKLRTIRLDSFIDTIEDQNEFYDFITQADALNKTLGRNTVNPSHHDSLSKTLDEKLSAYNNLKETAHSQMLDVNITINQEIKPLFQKLLRILDEIFAIYRRALTILSPQKGEYDKAVAHKILFDCFSFENTCEGNRDAENSYTSFFINAFNKQKTEIEKLSWPA